MRLASASLNAIGASDPQFSSVKQPVFYWRGQTRMQLDDLLDALLGSWCSDAARRHQRRYLARQAWRHAVTAPALSRVEQATLGIGFLRGNPSVDIAVRPGGLLDVELVNLHGGKRLRRDERSHVPIQMTPAG